LRYFDLLLSAHQRQTHALQVDQCVVCNAVRPDALLKMRNDWLFSGFQDGQPAIFDDTRTIECELVEPTSLSITT